MTIRQLAVLVLAVLPAPAAADPPRVTVRQWEIPQAPIVFERPPRVFQEVTTVRTYEITPRPRAELLELGGAGEVLELSGRPRYVPARPSIDLAAAYAPPVRPARPIYETPRDRVIRSRYVERPARRGGVLGLLIGTPPPR